MGYEYQMENAVKALAGIATQLSRLADVAEKRLELAEHAAAEPMRPPVDWVDWIDTEEGRAATADLIARDDAIRASGMSPMAWADGQEAASRGEDDTRPVIGWVVYDTWHLTKSAAVVSDPEEAWAKVRRFNAGQPERYEVREVRHVDPPADH